MKSWRSAAFLAEKLRRSHEISLNETDDLFVEMDLALRHETAGLDAQAKTTFLAAISDSIWPDAPRPTRITEWTGKSARQEERMTVPATPEEREAWGANPATRRLLEIIDDSIDAAEQEMASARAGWPDTDGTKTFHEANGAKRALLRLRVTISECRTTEGAAA